MSPPSDRTTRSSKSTPDTASFNFGVEFRDFLKDETNKILLRSAIVGPLLEEVRQLKKSLVEKDKTIDALQSQISDLMEKDKTIDALKSQVSDLVDKNDDLEQYTRRQSLRISGIPEEASEDCLSKTLNALNDSLHLDPPLAPSDIDRIHRTGRPRTDNKPRAVLIKFVSYRQRQRVTDNRKELDGSDIYVNEDLTRKRNQLFWIARKAKKDRKIKNCITLDGRISIKDLTNKTHFIKNEEDLNKIMNSY